MSLNSRRITAMAGEDGSVGVAEVILKNTSVSQNKKSALIPVSENDFNILKFNNSSLDQSSKDDTDANKMSVNEG